MKSPQVCVECFVELPSLEECAFCAECGVILCEECRSGERRRRHGEECALFVEAGHKFAIRLVRVRQANDFYHMSHTETATTRKR